MEPQLALLQVASGGSLPQPRRHPVGAEIERPLVVPADRRPHAAAWPGRPPVHNGGCPVRGDVLVRPAGGTRRRWQEGRVPDDADDVHDVSPSPSELHHVIAFLIM